MQARSSAYRLSFFRWEPCVAIGCHEVLRRSFALVAAADPSQGPFTLIERPLDSKADMGKENSRLPWMYFPGLDSARILPASCLFAARVLEEPLTMHVSMLDPQAELQRLNSPPLTNAAEVRALLQEVLARLAPLGMSQGELKPRDARSLRDEDERRLAAALLARFRQLPAADQARLPALLNALGKLQAAAGDFEGAKTIFLEVARAAADTPARA